MRGNAHEVWPPARRGALICIPRSARKPRASPRPGRVVPSAAPTGRAGASALGRPGAGREGSRPLLNAAALRPPLLYLHLRNWGARVGDSEPLSEPNKEKGVSFRGATLPPSVNTSLLSKQ